MAEELVILDVAFNGVSRRLIQISAWKLDSAYNHYDQFHAFINPAEYLFPRAIDVTGITDDMLKDALPADVVLPEFFEWCGNMPVAMYSMSDRIEAINSELVRYDIYPETRPSWRFDVKRLALRTCVNPFPDDYRLKTVYDFIRCAPVVCIDFNRVEMIRDLLRYFYIHHGMIIKEMGFKAWVQQNISLSYMPYGTHKGKKFTELSEIELRYARLSFNENNLKNEELLYSVEQELKRRKLV